MGRPHLHHILPKAQTPVKMALFLLISLPKIYSFNNEVTVEVSLKPQICFIVHFTSLNFNCIQN